MQKSFKISYKKFVKDIQKYIWNDEINGINIIIIQNIEEFHELKPDNSSDKYLESVNNNFSKLWSLIIQSLLSKQYGGN